MFNDFGFPVISVLGGHILNFFFDKREHFLFASEKRNQLFNQYLDLLQFLFHLLSLQPGQFLKTHFQYGVGLALGELELLHQVAPGLVHILRGSNGLNDLVYMIQRFLKTEQNVLSFFSPVQFKLAPALNYHFAVVHKLFQNTLEGQSLRYALNQGHHVVVERVFQLGMFIQVVKNRLRLGPLL